MREKITGFNDEKNATPVYLDVGKIFFDLWQHVGPIINKDKISPMKMKLPRLTVKKTHALTYSVVDPDLTLLYVCRLDLSIINSLTHSHL